jgi:CRP-like cAMP-binding protein
MVPISLSATKNHLLESLAPAEQRQVLAQIELCSLQLGDMLYEPGARMEHAFFPTTAMVSLRHVLRSGASAETAAVGNEGVVGISLCMGEDTSPRSAIIRTAGHGYRMPGHLLLAHLSEGGSMRRALLRYLCTFLTQTSQSVVCNKHHSLEQRFSRWLLFALDRDSKQELIVTQEQLAYMLGVRREGITEIAGRFQDMGFIQYRRRHITILDRIGLTRRTCECYLVVQTEMDRLIWDLARTSALTTSPRSLAGNA